MGHPPGDFIVGIHGILAHGMILVVEANGFDTEVWSKKGNSPNGETLGRCQNRRRLLLLLLLTHRGEKDTEWCRDEIRSVVVVVDPMLDFFLGCGSGR